MCGRFSLSARPEDISELLPDFEIDALLAPRYNIAPSQPVATILNDRKKRLTFTQWGLIPSWARDPTIGSRLINARAETLAEKPAYRDSLKRRRCLILADGFFEWRKVPGQKLKQPLFFRLKTGKPFAFAGLWDEWCDKEGGVLATSTIITTTPNALMKPVHNRMPVILAPAAFEQWLSPDERKPGEVLPCLGPYPADEMECHPVSSKVNSPRADDPECVKPLVSDTTQGLLL